MSAPDLMEPVIGFRAWLLSAEGTLGSWSINRSAWIPGVNEARCALSASHTAPARECGCGLYALTSADDPRLLPAHQAVGAVVAWGAVEAHPTGFRAQFAAVRGLCLDPRSDAEHTKRLRLAADSHGVALVPIEQLVSVALKFGRPIDYDALLSQPPAAEPGLPGLPQGSRGICIEEHVWLTVNADGVRLGVTRQLGTQVEIGSPLTLPDPGTHVCRGEPLATVGTGAGELVIRAPLDLDVEFANPQLRADPDLIRVEPQGAGWLLEATPTRWLEQARTIAWGDRADVLYSSSLADTRGNEDPFCWQRASWRATQPNTRSAVEVLRALEALQRLPRFRDEADVHAQIGGRVERIIGDETLRRTVCRAAAVLTLRLHNPDAELTLDLRAGRVAYGEAQQADIVLFTDAQSADDFLAGRIDIAAALRSRRIQTRAPVHRVLSVASLIKAIHAPYAAAGPL